MSSNDQVIVAPFPEDLEKYAVWLDPCVDNPFDFSQKPLDVFDDLEAAVIRAAEVDDGTVEYGINMLLRSKLDRYETSEHDESLYAVYVV